MCIYLLSIFSTVVRCSNVQQIIPFLRVFVLTHQTSVIHGRFVPSLMCDCPTALRLSAFFAHLSQLIINILGKVPLLVCILYGRRMTITGLGR